MTRCEALGTMFLLAAMVPGCGGSAADPFIGTWKCTGTDATSFSQPPNTMPTSEVNGASVVITDDGSGHLTRVRTPDNGAPVCTLHSTLNADRMSFTNVAGETCATKNGGTVTYKTGSAMISATGYTAASTWTFSGKTAGGAALVGDGTGTSTCSKM